MMRRCWSRVWLVLSFSCATKEPGGAGESDDSSGSSAGSTTTASADATGDSGGTGDGIHVDCADADDSWPTVGPPELSPLGFPTLACNPRTSGEALGFRCCSDDPAAPGGALPAYEGRTIDGASPLFADANNDLGVSGLCVDIDEIPAGFTLISAEAAGCPLPCDPTWSATDVATVCGSTSFQCCQTREIVAKDCVNDRGTWRPVTGDDVFLELTTWGPSSHQTHQDPSGLTCTELFGGSGPEWEDCIRQLHVANRRGYCMSVAECPAARPTYVDACEDINDG